MLAVHEHPVQLYTEVTFSRSDCPSVSWRHHRSRTPDLDLSNVSATRVEAGVYFELYSRARALFDAQISQAFAVWSDGIITPVGVLAVKVASDRLWCGHTGIVVGVSHEDGGL